MLVGPVAGRSVGFTDLRRSEITAVGLEYRPLDPEDTPEILEHYWQQLGITFDPVSCAEAANTVTRITGGNFRLIERIMSQVGRLLNINEQHTISPDIVEAARLTLVVGT